MAISYVGGVQGGRAGSVGTTTQSLTGLTGGSASAPAEGDFVVVWCAVGTAAPYNPTTLDISGNNSGAYNAETLQHADDTRDSQAQLSHKVMGATPDTSLTIPSSGHARNAQRWVVHVFRGVDATTPMDVAAVPASGINTGRPNPGAITPSTSGAWICALYASAAATGTAFTAPTDFATNWLGGTRADTYDCMCGGGYYTGWTSGSYDPAAITAGGTTGAGDSWTAHTIALKPAVNNYPLTCNSGSYTYTGQSATLLRSKSVTASNGSYTYTGQDAILTKSTALNHYTLTCNHGTFTYTGQSATLLRSKSITASNGSYSYTGQSATLLRSSLLTASNGSYTYSGQTANLYRNRNLTASNGGYTYTGQTANLYRNRNLTVSAGSYTYSGQTANITYQSLAAAYTLTCNNGTYSYTGQSANLYRNRSLTVTEGSYSYTGQSAVIARGRNLTAQAGSYALTGQSVTITHQVPGAYTLTAHAGSYAYTGMSADVSYIPVVIRGGSSRIHKKQRDYGSVSWSIDWQQPVIKQVEKVLDNDVVTNLKADRDVQPPSNYLDSLTKQLELYIQHLEDTITDISNAGKVINKMDKYAKLVRKLNALVKEQKQDEIRQRLNQKIIIKREKILAKKEFDEVQMLLTTFNNYF